MQTTGTQGSRKMEGIENWRIDAVVIAVVVEAEGGNESEE
jgi:hypothetical protein